MRWYWVIGLIGVFWVGGAVAQSGPRGGADMSQLTEARGLSEAQAGEVASILATQREERRGIMQAARSEGGGFAGARGKMQALRESTETRLAAVLSEDQMAQYRTLAEERRQQMRQRRGRPPQ